MAKPKYDCMPIDADTMLFRAAVILQQNYVIVTHKPSGKKMEFPNQTEFWGHWSKKAGGWLAEHNEERIEKGKEPMPASDFEIEQFCRPNPDIEDHIPHGIRYFKLLIKNLHSMGFARSVKVLLGNGGNFREGVAKTREYKANRPEKPMFFLELKEAIIKTLGDKIELVSDKEVDDQMAVYGLENMKHYKKTGKWKYILAYVDKDLKMIAGPAINYDAEELEAEIISVDEAAKWYAVQLLTGDKSTDNIQGLESLPNDFKEKYGIRKGRGVGEAAALKALEGCNGIAEYFERVCEAYRAVYGGDDDPINVFEDWQGETQCWTWRDYLQETAMLIYMNPLKDPLKYNVFDHFKKMGVNV